jgi:hypothetical protein
MREQRTAEIRPFDGREVSRRRALSPRRYFSRKPRPDVLKSRMSRFDFSAPADLFPRRSRKGNRPAGYRRFDTAAEAIRYAVEEMAAEYLAGAIIECEERRLDRIDILELYCSPDFPLARKSREGASADQAPAQAPATPTRRPISDSSDT